MDPERQERLILAVCQRIRSWGLEVPSIAFLEANKPFGFLGGQLVLFARPLLDLFVPPATTSDFVALLEERGGIDRLIQHLEGSAGDSL